MSQNYRLYINGQWRPAADGGTKRVLNPATEEDIGSCPVATSSDIDDALAASRAGLQKWRKTPATQRAGILKRAADILTERLPQMTITLTREQGKTLGESRTEIARTIETLEWNADHAAALCSEKSVPIDQFRRSVHPEPLGVVAAFVPWNYPLLLAARKLAPALGAGCCIILKGPEETPGVVVALVEALAEAGVPAGVVNLLFGEPSSIVGRLLSSPDVRMLTFTGSTAVGSQLAQAAGVGLKRCVFELGGHAPVIVFGDADVPLAARAIADYKFECAGQSCNAPSRVFIEDCVYGQFVDNMLEIAGKIRTGDGLDPSTDMGPMSTARRTQAMQAFIDDAVNLDGRILLGGRGPRGPGYFWLPTIVAHIPDGARLMREEPFGPILPVTQFGTFAEVIRRANDNDYGLAAYVFTRSESIAANAIRELDVGTVHVNQLKGVPADLGVGGVKQSGYGYEGGEEGFKAFMNLKMVGHRSL